MATIFRRSPILGLVAFLASSVYARDDLSARPLPGNHPCAFPQKAQKALVAGPVGFSVDVRPDGTVASVDVRTVPKPNLGFEEAVRDCLSAWHFEPASAGETGLRHHEGRIAFRLDAAREAAIRHLLEALASAWNSGDEKGVEDLSLQGPGSTARAPGYLSQQMKGDATEPWRMELTPEIESIAFLGPELATVRQGYRRLTASVPGVQPNTGEEQTLQAIVAADPGGWRLLSVAPKARGGSGDGIVRADSGRIREPRKVKDVQPRYPDNAKQARVQGVVILECLIGPDGKVRFVRILRGIPLLDVAAAEAVRQWEYTPTLLDGVPVPVFMTVTVNFRLS